MKPTNVSAEDIAIRLETLVSATSSVIDQFEHNANSKKDENGYEIGVYEIDAIKVHAAGLPIDGILWALYHLRDDLKALRADADALVTSKIKAA